MDEQQRHSALSKGPRHFPTRALIIGIALPKSECVGRSTTSRSWEVDRHVELCTGREHLPTRCLVRAQACLREASTFISKNEWISIVACLRERAR